MTDHDEKLTRRYREMAREEPAAELDAAILAASRRAVARPSVSRRWAMPVSVAAVLVLAVGVTLRMQQEQPEIETAAPMNEYSQPAAPAEPEKAPSPQPSAKGEAEQRLPAKPDQQRKLSRQREESRPQADKLQAAPARDSLMKEEAQPMRAEPKPFADAPAASTPAPMPAAPPPAAATIQRAPAMESGSALPPPRAKREAADAMHPLQAPQAAQPSPRPSAIESLPQRGLRGEGELQTPASAEGELQRELERIARLREEGRNAEADKALEEFRRANPGYRIPDAMWERVRAR